MIPVRRLQVRVRVLVVGMLVVHAQQQPAPMTGAMFEAALRAPVCECGPRVVGRHIGVLARVRLRDRARLAIRFGLDGLVNHHPIRQARLDVAEELAGLVGVELGAGAVDDVTDVRGQDIGRAHAALAFGRAAPSVLCFEAPRLVAVDTLADRTLRLEQEGSLARIEVVLPVDG